MAVASDPAVAEDRGSVAPVSDRAAVVSGPARARVPARDRAPAVSDPAKAQEPARDRAPAVSDPARGQAPAQGRAPARDRASAESAAAPGQGPAPVPDMVRAPAPVRAWVSAAPDPGSVSVVPGPESASAGSGSDSVARDESCANLLSTAVPIRLRVNQPTDPRRGANPCTEVFRRTTPLVRKIETA